MPSPGSGALTVSASSFARVHNVLSFSAFAAALLIGCALHYEKIVKNGVAGWPQEWFPSVSATIGDWYPERNVFQILIALNSGPRFAVLALSYLLARRNFPSSSKPAILLVTGIVRTLSCGGWVYITSNDDHDVHDILMILYIVCNIPWMWVTTSLSGGKARRHRITMASTFWLSLVPMIYFFLQHKVHRIPGAYTYYSFFEWSLILLDIGFDSVAEREFRDSGLQITIGIPADKDKQTVKGTDGELEIKKVAPSTSTPAHAGPRVKSTIVGSFRPLEEPPSWSRLATYRPALSFLADVYFSYQSWTLLTALPTTLFYFSVWKLALAGPEFSTLATLSPIFLASSHILSFTRSHIGRQILLLTGAAVGIGIWSAESVLTRLGGVIVGVMATVAFWAGQWADGGQATAYHSIVFLLGLVVSSLSKHMNHGNNPAWPIVDEASGGYHKTVLTIASLSLLEFMTRPPTSPYPTSTSEEPDTSKDAAEPTSSSVKQPWLASALALGALVFSLHERLTDPSTLIVWSWTGYPLTGPDPHVHAPLTLLAQSVGVLLALYFLPTPASPPKTNFLAHPVWYAIGSGSAYVLYAYRDWAGYAGSLVHAVFLMSIAPHVINNAGAAARARGAARVFTAAWLVWIILLFTSTFTVAYAFVPYAWSFREHTDWILSAQMALLAFGFDWRNILPSRAQRSPSATNLTLPFPARKHTSIFLALTSILALGTPLLRRPPPVPAPAPSHERARLFNAGIWTVHFGIDDAGRDSQRRIRGLIGDMQLDVVGLLETDLHRPVYGNRDLTRVMADELGYHVDIGPGPNKHTWGAVLLSKFPILKSTHHLLPSPHGELAPAIEAVLDIYGRNVTVIVAHNGQGLYTPSARMRVAIDSFHTEETPLDRQLQAQELARIMSASYPDPVVFLGYVVSKPKDVRRQCSISSLWLVADTHGGFTAAAPYPYLVEDGRVHDIDDDDADRWCEYIFYRGLYRTSYARVSRSTITDTELQIGQFVVPRYGHSVEKESREDRYLRAWREELPTDHWFPDAYYGDEKHGGVNGHFYHVFNTPLYYKIPEGAVL
ncbi:hypothetical protein EVG20_g957 [Dentipellis fragilis]|uniref:Uncharacterized protein n=1 Tax=Dentipellis fragilis TaxID=205917 RepID=A0A4Y9ZBU6_9AGAM|nr:hypothetical protein EVG20_g957 [Dentipellis fragilis]